MSGLDETMNDVDDELDKLIQQTSQVWKDFERTGIDLENDTSSLIDSNLTIPKKLHASSNGKYTPNSTWLIY